MIDILKKQIDKNMPLEDKINRMREFLQVLALKILYDKDYLSGFAFVGGTALRILYDIRRFSEDLDFSLIRREGYDFSALNKDLVRGFELYGLPVESKPDAGKTVHSSFLKFSGLLKEAGLSALASQKFSIKLEIDTNPPTGGNLVGTMVNKTYIFNVAHFDLPSSFSTKIHACFYRKFTKGRDIYDFIWYMGRKTMPNYELLNNAITQTEGANPCLDQGNLGEFFLKKFEAVDFDKAKKDIERFLEDKSELKLFSLNQIRESIKSVYS